MSNPVRVVPLAEAPESALEAFAAACLQEWEAIYRVEYKMDTVAQVSEREREREQRGEEEYA